MSISSASLSDNQRLHAVALLVAIAWVCLAIWLSGDYGPTWDCAAGDYAYGKATWSALGHAEDPVAVYRSNSEGTQRQPHPDFESHFVWVQLFPLAATLSAASCDLFWSSLGWLPPIAAHHLVISLFVAVLLYVIVSFLGKRVGWAGGVMAAAFLVASPRFFAHAQNNLKDIPEACLYSLCAIAFYRATATRNLRWWCGVGALAALALAQKQNALFLPVQFAITLVLFRVVLPSEKAVGKGDIVRGIAVGLVVFVMTYALVSPWFWADLSRLVEHWNEFFVVGGIGGGGVSWEGPHRMLVTTPVPLLLAGLVGAFARLVDPRLKIFLVTWVLFTTGRLLLPGMRNFDGVRHFLEFYPPLCMLAALGVLQMSRWVRVARIPSAVGPACIGACFVLPGAVVTITTHPNGICYFNAVIGGLPGAVDRGLPEAADYWGNSYWQGITWLNEHAPQGTQILSPISPQILRCGSYRLREDLGTLAEGDTLRAPLCVIYTTHRGNYGPLIRHLEAEHVPTTQIFVQDAPILQIHVFTDPEIVADIAARLKREARAKLAIARVVAWAQIQTPVRTPEVMKLVEELQEVGLEESTRRLRSMLPALLHQDAADLLWWRQETTLVPGAGERGR